MNDDVGSLSDKYIIPPTTVLDTGQGYWIHRKRLWQSLGLSDSTGREEGLTFDNSTSFVANEIRKVGATSSFDPVLCEMMYRWFSPPGGMILDPFAGGPTRGVVAGKLGRSYVGVDLRQEQIDHNLSQKRGICPDSNVRWVQGDSQNLNSLVQLDAPADLVFSCPPYGSLEQYCDDPQDLSNMTVEGFEGAYRNIIAKACGSLARDRFAAFVVGNYRVRDALVDLVGMTVRAFEAAGLPYYNQFILVNPVATLRFRLAGQFDASRKAGNRHQHILVFVKGDPRAATKALGKIDPRVPEGLFGAGEDDFLASLLED
jgi:hypothetical protein